ncbi:MAG TPA: hypothetical protein PKZ76_02640 [Xanthomonadaceae bacterium]|nr:hypothetical protein [Xanthomonadaceae bacterium]
MRKLGWVVLWWMLAGGGLPVHAVEVPPALRDWQGWVLHDEEHRQCPVMLGQAVGPRHAHLCAWPERLRIEAGAEGARFRQTWIVYADSFVPLPGDERLWPQGVTANGEAVAVVRHERRPSLWLRPGTYRIDGRIDWRRRPERLAVPDVVALIDLSVDGERVMPAQRFGPELRLGQVVVEEVEAAPRRESSLDLVVYRLVVDGVPQRLLTQLQLDVAGDAREIELGPVLPQGFIATALQSDLAARLHDGGNLRVQVVEGKHSLRVVARGTSMFDSIAMPAPAAPWPGEEVWSFSSDSRLRVAVAGGGENIDPSISGTPFEHDLPAFVMRAGDALAIDVRSRGLSATEDNRLQLNRRMWLDHAGAGFYLRDRIHGQMRRDWRLDTVEPLRLQNVLEGGRPVQASLGPVNGLAGVELRDVRVDVEAGLRMPRSLTLPVSGWQQNFDAVTVDLRLPPGWKLLGAPGVDRAPGTWAARWTLLDVFLVLIATVLALRLWGIGGAVLAGGFLLIAYHELGVPFGWLLAALVLALILRALPPGRLASTVRVFKILVLLALVLVGLPFVAGQVRMALHPQLEHDWLGGFSADWGMVMQDARPMAEPAPAPVRSSAGSGVAGPDGDLDRIEVTGSRIKRSDIEGPTPLEAAAMEERAEEPSPALADRSVMERYDPGSVLQAGQGIPDWQGQRHTLHWGGPVLADQEYRLLLLPPWLTRLLRWLMVILLAALSIRLIGQLRGRSVAPGSAAALLLAPVLLWSSPEARAQATPEPQLLQQLRERLLEAPPCQPECASIAAAEIVIDGDRFSMALEVHALERVAVPMPLAENAMIVERVAVDGIAREGLRRRVASEFWVDVARGVHRVEYAARVDGTRFGLRFAAAPRQIRVRSAGWQVGGLGEDRLQGDSLSFVREVEATESAADVVPAAMPETRFAPFVQLVRRVHIGLDIRVESSVRRIAPDSDGFSTRLPLLPGERVLSGGEHVDDGYIDIAFDARSRQRAWSGTLPLTERIEIAAPTLDGHAEVWQFAIGPQWHPQFNGVPAVLPQDLRGGWYWEFHPLPGETLTLNLSRVQALPGDTLSIDKVDLQRSAGRRSAETQLGLDLRATQGGDWQLALPEHFEMLSLSMDGAAQALRPENGVLTLPLRPGSQRVALTLREATPIGFVSRSAEFDLGRPAVNLRIEQNLPADRWVLWTSGPRLGPAVLYWGELLLMIALAVALGRSGRTPLKTWHWLLLGLGFSTLSWVAPVLVVAWLLAMDWRARGVERAPWYAFNALQVGLVLFTVVAVLTLVAAIPFGLLGTPDMHLTGNSSTPTALRWFADRSEGVLPVTTVVSLPLWVYKTAMLLWALWLANALIGWLRWSWASWTAGDWWRAKPAAAKAEASA